MPAIPTAAPAAPAASVVVVDLRTGVRTVCTLDAAAAAVDLDPDDIAWAIEEAGECTTDAHAVYPID